MSKEYRGRSGSAPTRALDDVSLDLEAGAFVSILGPSGCGKSTLLNCIAGLTSFDSGSILVDEKPIDGPGLERAVVFQHASLLPWRTAVRNVMYGMEMQGRFSRQERRERAQQAIDLVGLSGFEGHYPSELSGGMQQRVNLARALATEPRVLLMDEPFGALDALTKQRMQEELQRISVVTGHTVIFITHDISEAVFLGDRVVLMSPRPGRIANVVDVPVDRPRPNRFKLDPEFQKIRNELWDQLESGDLSSDDESS